MLNRSDQPRILEPEQLVVQRPERIKLPNGVPLSVLNAGDNEVTRIDLLMAGGRWQQKQPLQALFTNRMLREGTRRYDAARIAEKLDYYGAWLELSSASEYAYVTLYSLNKYLPQTLDILESIVKEPVFPEKELGVIVDNNIQQFLVNSSKVDFLAHRGLVKALYGGQHPGGRQVQGGGHQQRQGPRARVAGRDRRGEGRQQHRVHQPQQDRRQMGVQFQGERQPGRERPGRIHYFGAGRFSVMGVKWEKQSVEELRKRKSRAELQKENEALREQVESLEGQLTDTQMALCDVFEMLVPGDDEA